MTGGDVIKSFLVGLGFSVDDASLKKFNQAIATATIRVAALATATSAAWGGITAGVSDVSQSFEDLGYQFRIIAPAINKAIILRNEMLKAFSASGINITKTVLAAYKLNLSLAKTKFALEALYKSTASKFFGIITKQSDLFRKMIYANMPKIQHVLESFVNFFLKTFQALTELGTRLWSILGRVFDFFVMLDKATHGWSTIILGAVAAWKLLNLGFLATPFGLLIAGLTALLALWDDFKTFREGGQSLINWGSNFTKTLVGLGSAIAGVALAFGAWSVISQVIGYVQGLITLVQLLTAVVGELDLALIVAEAPFWAIVAAVTAVISVINILGNKLGLFKTHWLESIGGLLASLGGKTLDFLAGSTGQNVAANIQNNPIGRPLSNPVSSNVTNSNSNLNVNNQTQINVTSSADAQHVGNHVAGLQGRVNMDNTENLKGATR
jgi:hypothetical protein